MAWAQGLSPGAVPVAAAAICTHDGLGLPQTVSMPRRARIPASSRPVPARAHTRTGAVADRLRRAIAVGTFRYGDRLPSVRELATRWSVGINTVVAAYRMLETAGLVLAAPRSGFRVLPQAPLPPPPRPGPAADMPVPVDLDSVMARAVANRGVPGMVSLGLAIHRPGLLPLAALRRHMRREASQRDDLLAIYDGPMGQIDLRQAVARRLTRAGAVVGADAVIVTNGAQEGLLLALRATCPPGSCVAVESPAYHGLYQVIAALGLTCLEIPSASDTGIAVEALAAALDDHPVAAVVCSAACANPGGSQIPPERQRELVRLCLRRGVPLIDDDTYGDLVHVGVRAPPCIVAAGGDGGGVIHIGSFSKSVAPGLRLGFLVPGRWLDAVRLQKVMLNITTAAPGQAAVASLLDSGDFDRHWVRMAPRLAEHVRRTSEQIARTFPPGTRVSQPRAGVVLWVEMPDQVDADRLYADAIRAGVCVAPGTLFSARRRYRHHIRITAGWWDQSVAAAIARVGALACHQGRR
jgi:DNA-binding transcriptional MocR family regulator